MQSDTIEHTVCVSDDVTCPRLTVLVLPANSFGLGLPSPTPSMSTPHQEKQFHHSDQPKPLRTPLGLLGFKVSQCFLLFFVTFCTFRTQVLLYALTNCGFV